MARAAAHRVLHEPAYVLHQHDWSESSLILEVLTRHHGRVALVAKGVKRPTSSFRPVLLPLQPLQLNYGGEGDIRTLKGAEWVGGHIMPLGDALLAGYYLNELLLRLLARDDPHPRVFDLYAVAVRILASAHGEALQPTLRSFELLLLRELGYLPSLDSQTLTYRPLEPETTYCLVPEAGLREAQASDRGGLTGQQWLALQQVLDRTDDPAADFTPVLRACAGVMQALKPQLRQLLHYHCGVNTLHTRRVMMELQDL